SCRPIPQGASQRPGRATPGPPAPLVLVAVSELPDDFDDLVQSSLPLLPDEPAALEPPRPLPAADPDDPAAPRLLPVAPVLPTVLPTVLPDVLAERPLAAEDLPVSRALPVPDDLPVSGPEPVAELFAPPMLPLLRVSL